MNTLTGSTEVREVADNSAVKRVDTIQGMGRKSKSQQSRCKFLYYAAFIVMSAMFSTVLTSCDKDPKDGGGSAAIVDGKLTISVENGSSHKNDIDKVKVQFVEWDASTGISKYETLASSNFGNGTFTLELPANVDAKYLRSIDVFSSTVNVSNKNAKFLFDNVRIFAYNGNDKVDEIICGKVITQKNNGKVLCAFAGLMYSDSDVSISGTEKYTDENGGNVYENNTTYSINLKQGWNLVYMIDVDEVITGNKTVYTGNMTSSAPGGLKWYLEEDFDALFDK